MALSGGSDSLVLLWLSRSVFDKVVAITVDHKYVSKETFLGTVLQIVHCKINGVYS